MLELNQAVTDPLRRQVMAVLDQARNDDRYAERLRQSPQEVLSQAGLDERAVGELSAEINTWDAEVEGHASGCHATCDIISCWVTICGYLWATN